MTSPNEHSAAGLKLLNNLWAEVTNNANIDDPEGRLAEAIDTIFAGTEVGYKKAIIIQLVGKATDFSRDAQALQKGTGEDGAWDARSFGKKVFVPWNASIGNPLGDSDEPYVGQQFRNPRFDASIRARRRNKELFDLTLGVLEAANSATSPADVEKLLRSVLTGLRRLMHGKSFDYPIPQRASLDATQGAVARFLSVASGGGRLQAVAHALFKSLSAAGFDYADLAARHVNASDVAARSSGDVSYSKAGRNSVVEVKDRLLTSAQVSASVTKARIAEVSELIFLVHGKKGANLFTSDAEQDAAEAIGSKEFSSGLNLYWEPYLVLSRSVLVIIGEQGRRDFLKFVGLALEEQSVDAQHRWAWAQIVAEI